jgi:hypothetical protein
MPYRHGITRIGRHNRVGWSRRIAFKTPEKGMAMEIGIRHDVGFYLYENNTIRIEACKIIIKNKSISFSF